MQDLHLTPGRRLVMKALMLSAFLWLSLNGNTSTVVDRKLSTDTEATQYYLHQTRSEGPDQELDHALEPALTVLYDSMEKFTKSEVMSACRALF